MTLSRLEALALLPDLPEGGISAADARTIVGAIYDSLEAHDQRLAAFEPGAPDHILGRSPGMFAFHNQGSYSVSWVPIDLAHLQSLGNMDETTAWASGEWVVLVDGTFAHWGGSSWEVGKA